MSSFKGLFYALAVDMDQFIQLKEKEKELWQHSF